MSAELVIGELTDPGVPHALACPVPGVTARRTRRRYAGRTHEKRLYECANGLALGARRGGPLDQADGDTWEVWSLDERGLPIGESVGWVDEALLERTLRRLAAWPWSGEAVR